VPREHLQADLIGELHLYRPSAAGMDRRLPLKPEADGTQILNARDLAPGLWKAQLHWTAGGQDYFVDRRLVLPPIEP
jgi:hypothetical protein